MTRPSLSTLLMFLAVMSLTAAGCGGGANQPQARPDGRATTAKPSGAATISVSENRRVAIVSNARPSDPELTAQDISDAIAQLRCYDYTVQTTPITQRGYLTGVIAHCQRAAKGDPADDLR
jgi:hypothetical protein